MNLPWKKSLKREDPKPNAGAARPDFTLYFDGSHTVLRAENPSARKHLEDNAADYAQWLVRFCTVNRSSFLLRKHGDNFFVKPGCVLAELTDTLMKRGFVVVNQRIRGMNEPSADADFLIYYDGPTLLLRPQQSTAREFIQRNLAAYGQAWLGGAVVIKHISVMSLVHKLKVAGFNVVGQSAIINAGPQLYAHDGEWGLYNAGVIPRRVAGLILNGAGSPN